MKKVILVVLCFTLLSASVLMISCGSSSTSNSTANSNNSNSTKTFTLDELKKYNGQNGAAAYVAINGTVYDVTNSKKWNNGQHQGVSAGTDLSSQIGSAPHGTSVLGDAPIVGTLK